MTDFYQPRSGLTFSEENLASQTGLNPEWPADVLSTYGVYPIVPATDPYDQGLYSTTPAYTINGFFADQYWVATPLPLSTAKDNASDQVKAQSNNQASDLVAASGVNVDIWAGAASQDPLDRPPVYNALLGEMASIGDTLATKLTAIASATDVETLNNIVQQPSGELNTGRGGPGQAGPQDLNLSYFSLIENLGGFTQADLELYVPGTDTVISYTDELPEPYKFDSMGDCFTEGDYRLVIRYAGGGAVISTITVPEGANTDVAWTYDPVIPAP